MALSCRSSNKKGQDFHLWISTELHKNLQEKGEWKKEFGL